jgi:hypothetical protein
MMNEDGIRRYEIDEQKAETYKSRFVALGALIQNLEGWKSANFDVISHWRLVT